MQMGFFSRFGRVVSKPELEEEVASSETKSITVQPKQKGGLRMRHEVEIKVPKFLNPLFENLTPEEKKKFGRVALMGGSVVLGATVIYLTGYNRGMKKAISSNNNRGVYIVRGGE
jgi:hypothetical protein